jgi:phospholipase/carboxylesterase
MQQRLLVTHGTFDPLIPFAMAQGQVRQLKAAGLNVEWHEFAKVHTIAEDEIAVVRDFVRAGYPVVGK